MAWLDDMQLPPTWLLQASPCVDVRGSTANEILPGLWLGRGQFAIDWVAGSQGNPAHITHVLTVANDTPEVQQLFEHGSAGGASDRVLRTGASHTTLRLLANRPTYIRVHDFD